VKKHGPDPGEKIKVRCPARSGPWRFLLLAYFITGWHPTSHGRIFAAVPGPQLRVGFFGTQTKTGLPSALFVTRPLTCHPSGHGLGTAGVTADAGIYFVPADAGISFVPAKAEIAINIRPAITKDEIIFLDMLPPLFSQK